MNWESEMEWKTFAAKRYNGLINQGATCYLNCVLQCLYMTEDFRKEVENFRRNPENLDGKSGHLMHELQQLFTNLKEGKCSTERITECLDIKNVYEQQDVVEYYQKTLEAIGPQMSKIFQGKISNHTKCQHNHLFREKCPFFTIPLSIDVEPSGTFNVDDGFKRFFEKVKLDDDNLVYCENCDQKTEADTWTEIEEFPTVLTLYLKRFYFDYNQMALVKNDCTVIIPQCLQTSNFEYELYAVINHKGGRNGGHYNAVIRPFEDNKWHCFDDDLVREVPDFNLQLSKQAYLLMYRKKGDDAKSTTTTKELQHHCKEYCEGVEQLLQWIQHYTSVFEKTRFSASHEDQDFLHDFNKELLQKLDEKQLYFHNYNHFESAVQAGQVNIHPSMSMYHPTHMEREFDRLNTAILNWKQLYEWHFARESRCEEQLNQTMTLQHMAPQQVKKSYVYNEEQPQTELDDTHIGKQTHIEHYYSNKVKKGEERAVTVKDISKDKSLEKYCKCIKGVYVEATKKLLSIDQALKETIITPGTALLLLEAQAATGCVIDPVSNQKPTVSEAVEMKVVEKFAKSLLYAKKAVTGYTHRDTGRITSLLEAIEVGQIEKAHGIRLLKVQIATGGIIDPKDKFRLALDVAYERGLIDEKMKILLIDPSNDALNKNLFDPNTGKNLTYSQLMEQCITVPETGLFVLPLKEKK